MPSAIKSQLTKLAYSDGGSPSSFTNVANVTTIDGIGGGSATVIDTSNLDSMAKEKLMGLPDEGEISAALNYDPDNATHIYMRAARIAQTRLEFKVTFVDTAPATTAQFYGYVKTFKIGVAVNKQVTADMSIEIDGQVIWN